jgi:peptide/nickel transport system permease protein
MRQYILQRLLGTVPVLLGIVTLVFFLMRVLPGDPVAALIAQSGGSSADAARLRAEYGLDRPLGLQYLSFLFHLGGGDLGRSVFTGQSVSQIIAQQAPETIALACTAITVAIVLGLPLGIVASAQKGSFLDKLCMGISVLGVSVPIALSGLVMILVFSLTLYWLPAGGQGSLRHLIMPAMAMGLASAGSIARVVRTQLIEVLNQDYINIARAKGLSERTVLLRHALRNALLPVLTLVGLQFGFMLGGAAVTESVFARQGLGRTLVDAILYQDYPVVQGIVIVGAALYTAVNLVVDIAHCYLDPRVSY